MDKLDVVIWKDKTYDEISEQDNPATYGDECIMICKLPWAADDRFEVRKVERESEYTLNTNDVLNYYPSKSTIIGRFWEFDYALLFANLIAKSK